MGLLNAPTLIELKGLLAPVPIRNLTKEKVDELIKRHQDKQTEHDLLYSKEIKTIWLEELAQLDKQLK